MTPEELQDLSRRAAGCLPKGFFSEKPGETRLHLATDEGTANGKVCHWEEVSDYQYGDYWLHESTEACCEIMVRVLFEADRGVTLMQGGFRYEEDGGWAYIHFEHNRDVLAYRVAVLLAICALKEGK